MIAPATSASTSVVFIYLFLYLDLGLDTHRPMLFGAISSQWDGADGRTRNQQQSLCGISGLSKCDSWWLLLLKMDALAKANSSVWQPFLTGEQHYHYAWIIECITIIFPPLFFFTSGLFNAAGLSAKSVALRKRQLRLIALLERLFSAHRIEII